FGACDADTVFGRERPFKLLHQGRGLIRDLAKFLQIGGIMKVEHRPYMQQPARGMSVIRSFKVEWSDNRFQAEHIFRQPRWSYWRVFDERPRFFGADTSS